MPNKLTNEEFITKANEYKIKYIKYENIKKL